MANSRYVKKIESLKITSNILDYLDLAKKFQPGKSLFFITFFLSLVYSADPSNIWRTSISVESFLFYGASCLLIVGFVCSLKLNQIDQKAGYVKKWMFTYSWSINKTDAFYCLLINLFIMLSLGAFSYFSNLKFSHSVVFFLYFYNTAYIYIYCNDYSKGDHKVAIFHVKVMSTLIYAATVYLGVAWMQDNPLLLTSVLWLFPFYVSIFLSKKIKLMFLLYRVSFFIIAFFLAATIFPYFFCLGILLVWISKFYYLFKYNIKYPSFIEIYDNS